MIQETTPPSLQKQSSKSSCGREESRQIFHIYHPLELELELAFQLELELDFFPLS